MTKNELKTYQRQLLALAARIRGDAVDLRDEALDAPRLVGQVADLRADVGDTANHESERDVALSVLGSEQDVQGEIETALARIADKTFGLCGECGKTIPQTRLRSVPYARYCVGCAKRHEAETLP